jgi:GTPase SAR1 family protein
MKIETGSPSALSLPTKLSLPREDLGDFSLLIYGLEKVGKTSFLAQFPEALFLMCEPGGRDLSIYQREVMDWRQFKGYIDLLEKNRSDFKTVVVDTADRCFKMCEDYMLRKLVIQHASDEDFGKGYSMIRDEFSAAIIRLLKLGRGVAFTSHALTREVKARSGVKYDRTMPTMSKQAREILEPIVDIWGYMEYNDQGDRVLRLRGDTQVAAGHRLQNHFHGVDAIPMGKSAEEAYRNFLTAFDNKLQPEIKPALQTVPGKSKLKIGR